VERCRVIATADLAERAAAQGSARRPKRLIPRAAVEGAAEPVALAVID
jgi:hypothetical protein